MEDNEIYALDSHQQEPVPEPGQGKGEKGGKYFFCGLVTGLLLALLTASGVYLANRIQNYTSVKAGTESSKTEEKKEDKAEKETDDTAIDKDTYKKLCTLETIIDLYYYKEDVDKEALEIGAYKGLVAALGDPYSEYYSAEELEALYDSSQGIYYGIGAYVQLDADTTLPRLTGIIKGTPAEEADLRADDLVYKIEGEEMYGYTLQQAVSMMKGEEGTYVNITILRNGEEIEKTVQHRKVESPTVN